jgi:putative addiction module component (TIGR02574 family)
VADAKHHLDELLKLSADERAWAAQVLLESLEDEERDPTVEAAWAKEIERRVADHLSGKRQGIPAEEVFARLRERFQPKP